MKIIKIMSEQIGEEICDAEKYIKLALQYKEEKPDVAQFYAKLSDEEMGHMTRIHDMVAGIIRDYRVKNGEPPEGMLAVYEYLHEKHIEEAAEVRAMQDMYRK